MKNFILFNIIFIFITVSYGQCVNLTPLSVINPSFEGTPGRHITPFPWNTCGITPDTQPNQWGVTLPPSNGNSYVGFVNGGSTWLEGASQQLSGNMQAGVNYAFSIDLASTTSNGGGINPAPSSINIYGAMGICQATELLWSSPTVTNTANWQTFNVTFTPSQNFSHIYFRINENSPNLSYILLDNITPIFAQQPNIFITSHSNGDNENCVFNLSGNITNAITDSVVLTGNFTESPLKANLNNLNWNGTLNFNAGGNQTITATAFYTDPISSDNTCVFADVSININSPTANFSLNNVCQDESITFTDSSTPFGTNTLTNWNWDFGDGNTSTATSPSHTYNTPGTKNVTLSVTSSDGCTAILTQTLDVYDLPNTNFVANDTCLGDVTSFSNLSTILNGTIDYYNWDFGDGNTSNNQNITHTYSLDGTYNVTLTSTSNNGCITSLSKQVEVFSEPIASYSFINDCLYEEVNFTDNSTINTGQIIDWQWNFGDGNTSSSSSPNYTYTNDGTYNTSLIITSDKGCDDTLHKDITRFPIPNPNFSAAPQCLYTPISFINNSNINSPDNISSYVWNFGDGSSLNTDENPNHTYPTEGDYNVNLIATSNNGCIANTSYTITVYPVPVALFTNTEICENTPPTNFTNQSSIVTGSIVLHNWNFGDGNTSNMPNPSNFYSQAGTYNSTLIVTSNYGCQDTLEKTVIVLEKPNVDFSSNIIDGCSPICVTFDDLSFTNNANSIYWEWDFGNGQTNNTSNPTSCFKNLNNVNDTSFSIKLITKNSLGCLDTLNKNNFITVYHNPISLFDIAPPNSNMYLPNFDFINNSIGADLYEWDMGDNTYSTNFELEHSYKDTGSYNVILIAKTINNCTDTSNNIVKVDAVTNIYVPNAFTPNGDGDNDIFNVAGYNLNEIELSIFDKWGTLIFFTNDINRGWDGEHKSVPVKTDTYIWKLNVIDGHGKTHNYKGHVSLLR